jgi:hypothetical protein
MSDKPSKKKHGKRFWFWARFSTWTILSVIIPVAVIFTQYELFAERSSTTKITGWGLIALISLGGGVFYIVKSLADAEHNPWVNGMIKGFTRIILPLLAVYLLTGIIAFNLEKIRVILVVTMLAEGIALPINPLPQYVAEKKKKRKMQETIGISSEELKSIAKIAEMAVEKERVR